MTKKDEKDKPESLDCKYCGKQVSQWNDFWDKYVPKYFCDNNCRRRLQAIKMCKRPINLNK